MAKKTAFDRIQLDLTKALNGRGLIFTPFHAVEPEKFETFAEADDHAWTDGRAYQTGTLAAQFVRVNGDVRAGGTQFDFLVQEKPDGPYIAYANVMSKPHTRTASFGFFVLPAHRNKGIATGIGASVTEALAEIAPKLGMKQFTASVKDDNAPSLRVMEKLGIEPKGTGASSFGRPGNYMKYAERVAGPRER